MEMWFGIADSGDGQFDVGTMSDAERLFADALRHRAGAWQRTGCVSFLTRDCDGTGPLIAVLHLNGRNTVGVHFDGVGIRCDEVHNQLFNLPENPSRIAFEAHGGPIELGDLAAAWFEAQS